MALVAINLSRKSIPVRVEKSRHILSKFTGNPSFPNPVPMLPEFEKRIKALSSVYKAALNRGTTEKKLMRLALANLMKALGSLAAYVQTASGGDPALILSSGFDVKKSRSPVGILPAPLNLRGKLGVHPGEILLLWGGVKNKKLYRIQINAHPGDESQWKEYVFISKNRRLIKGLASGTSYQFRIACMSTAGIGSNCDAIEVKVL
jgi:hypothetical protein